LYFKRYGSFTSRSGSTVRNGIARPDAHFTNASEASCARATSGSGASRHTVVETKQDDSANLKPLGREPSETFMMRTKILHFDSVTFKQNHTPSHARARILLQKNEPLLFESSGKVLKVL